MICTAITTAPRQTPVLAACRASLSSAGFTKTRIYAEPDSCLTGILTEDTIVQRPRQFGAWHNWLFTAYDMLQQTTSQGILIVQDDTLWNPGSYQACHRLMWPNPHTAFIAVCVSSGYRRWAGPVSKRGKLFRLPQSKGLMGAWGLLFPRESLEKFVDFAFAHGWRGTHNPATAIDVGHHKKGIDAYLGEMTGPLGLTGYACCPSMAEHTARNQNSTLGHHKVKGWRLSIRSALEWRKEENMAVVFSSRASKHDTMAINGNARPENDVSVVIPMAGDCVHLLEPCLWSLCLYGDHVRNVVIVDNGSPVGSTAAALCEQYGLPYDVITNERNLGYTYAVNQGISASKGDHVLLLNTDCRIGPDCLKLLRQCILQGAAAAGPLTNDDGQQSLKQPNRLKQSGLDRPLTDYANLQEICSRLNIAEVSSEKELSFFCVLLNKQAIEAVGTLDTRLPSGLMADNEWCRRATKLGWALNVHPSAYAEHLHKQTFRLLKMDRNALHKRAIEVYKELENE